MAGSSSTLDEIRAEFLQLASARGLTEAETEELWRHCAHLSHEDILRLYDGFFIAKTSERDGLVRLLDARVPVAYIQDIGCDPRYDREPPRGYYGVSDTIALNAASVPAEYAVAVGEQRWAGEVVAALYQGGVPVEYVLATKLVPVEVVVACWKQGIAPEYVL